MSTVALMDRSAAVAVPGSEADVLSFLHCRQTPDIPTFWLLGVAAPAGARNQPLRGSVTAKHETWPRLA